MRYMITNANKIQFLKQVNEARKRGSKIIKVKQNLVTNEVFDRAYDSRSKYTKIDRNISIQYTALIEMSDKDARTGKDTQDKASRG